MATFDADAANRIADAVRDVERRSAAELVVEIRSRSGSYAHAGARFAALLTLVSLVVLVFMPLTVPAFTVLLDAVAVYLAGLAIARWVPAVRRLFSSRKEREQAVRTHAAALFHERGIANTAAETGVLLYVSLLERRMEVLADRGVLRKVNAAEWNALQSGGEPPHSIDDVIAMVRALGVILERDLPVGEGDVDELSNLPEIA